MKLLRRMFFSVVRKRIKVNEFKVGKKKIYFMVIARDADVDIDSLYEYCEKLGLNVVTIFSNYVEGIKFL